jgi:hypothetical protein
MAKLKIDQQLSDDAFDAFMRDEAPYLDDAGFTARVVCQLPARNRHRSLRGIILIGVALLASMIAYMLSDRGLFVREEIARLSLLSPMVIMLAAIGVGLLVTVAGAFGALSKAGPASLR